MPPYFFGGGNVKIILCESGTSGAGKADAAATGLQTERISVIQFYTDHYICGNTYRSVWALREYPTATDEQAILRHLGEKDGVTLRIYTRPEFDNDLVRRLIASIKVVSADKLIIQFQSGIVMEQEISYD